MASRIPSRQLGLAAGRLLRLRSCSSSSSSSRSSSSSLLRRSNLVGRRELSQKYQGQHQQQQQQQQLLRCTRRTFATAADHNNHNHHHLESPSFDILAQLDINPETLQSLASQQPTPLSLSAMHKYAAMKDHRLFNAQFLHKELQIRIAQRAVDLLTLPLGLSKVEAIRQVARVYLQYLKQLQETPSPTTTQEEDAFTELLQSFVLDRTTIPTQIARGVQDWNKTAPLDPERLQEMEDVLYRFFTARVGLRFLIEHHVLTSPNPNIVKKGAMTSLSPLDDDEDEDEDEQAKQGTSSQSSSSSSSSAAAAVSGCIQSNLNVVQETQRVAALVKKQTLQAYGCCPEMEIVDCIHQNKKNHHKQQHSNNSNTRKKGFTYVPHHLHYMTAEILTNACRATVQQYLIKKQTDEKAELLRIRVVLVMGKEDITIKVCDRGGGIQRSRIPKIWKFGHSTTGAIDELDTELNGTEEVAGAHIRGFGLPLARIYARYFGGELSLKSLEGHGVDAYLHLPRLGEEGENLPLRVRASPGELDSMPSPVERHFATPVGTPKR